MKICILIILIALIALPADAWQEKRWVDEDGCLNIVGIPENEDEAELARLTNQRNILLAELAQKKLHNDRLLQWLVQTRNDHEVELKTIEQNTSLNYLKATENLMKYNNDSRDGNIYIDNSRYSVR